MTAWTSNAGLMPAKGVLSGIRMFRGMGLLFILAAPDTAMSQVRTSNILPGVGC